MKVKLRTPKGLPPLTPYAKIGYYAPSRWNWKNCDPLPVSPPIPELESNLGRKSWKVLLISIPIAVIGAIPLSARRGIIQATCHEHGKSYVLRLSAALGLHRSRRHPITPLQGGG